MTSPLGLQFYSAKGIKFLKFVGCGFLGCDCSHVGGYQHIKGCYKRSSETLASTYKSTQRHNPEDQNRHLHCRENFKSHIQKAF
jgi:hypothetical protein